MNKNGLLGRKAPIDGSVKVTVPESFRQEFFYDKRYPSLVGHPGTSQMYDELRRQYYWLRMAADVQLDVSKCKLCRKNRPSLKNQRWMHFFPPNMPLEFVAINRLGPTTMERQGNRFITVMTDWYTKLTRAIPCLNVTAPVVEKLFLKF